MTELDLADNSLPTDDCPNCKTPKTGRFCHVCGQNDRDYRRSFFRVVTDILKETFEVDSRFWRTLKSLLLRPGHLTIEFSENRRASYITPIRLYLFTSLLFFFLVSIQTDPSTLDLEDDEAESDGTTNVEQVASLRQALDVSYQQKLDSILTDGSAMARSTVKGLADAFADDGTISELEKRASQYTISAVEDPRRFIDELIDNLPVVMFVLLPLYTLMLALFNLFNRRYLAEHLVFAVHFHTFAFIVFILMLIVPDPETLDGVQESWAETYREVLGVVLAVYGFIALKRFYGNGYALTTIKYCTMCFLYFFMLVPAFIVLTIFTASTI